MLYVLETQMHKMRVKNLKNTLGFDHSPSADCWTRVDAPKLSRYGIGKGPFFLDQVWAVFYKADRKFQKVIIVASFASLKKQVEILFRLICCEGKILFRLKKNKLKSTDYKRSEQGHNM